VVYRFLVASKVLVELPHVVADAINPPAEQNRVHPLPDDARQYRSEKDKKLCIAHIPHWPDYNQTSAQWYISVVKTKTAASNGHLPIAQRRVSELLPSAYNSRTHSDQQILQIANSIKEFGFLVPVLIDQKDSIIAGHGRVLAAKNLEMETVPCIQVSHLSEVQKRAYIIADNKLTELGGWDKDILLQELNFLDTEGFKVEMTGFDISMILPPVDDNLAEYVGMPEYNNEHQLGMRHLIVHFNSNEAVDDFAKLVNQSITDRTRFIWYPEEPEGDLHGKVYD
jgi:hypothetical protein